jgi:hypothetical protein
MNVLEAGRRRLGPGCLSDLALDQLWTGESAGTPLESLRRTHLGRCEACARRMQEIEVAAGAFLARPDGARRLAAQARSRRRWAWGAGTTLLAGAAAALGLLVWPTSPSEPGVRLKGAPVGLTVYVKRRAGAVEALPEGGAAEPGDVLRFVVTPQHDGYVGVISIDGAGEVNAYAPQGSTLVPARAGQALALEGGIELDHALGRERLAVFACAEPLAKATLLERVATLVREGRARSEAPLDVRHDCLQSWLWFEKVRAR